jgi:disulfide bond formation protein DsbB
LHDPRPEMHIWHMRNPDLRIVALACTLAAAVALGVALASEHWGGLVPCALCLLERWPWRAAIVLGILASFLPRRAALGVLILLAVIVAAGAGLAVVHVGVEQGLWRSPLPECAAPRLSGGSIAQRLASMPARPTKPCDAPTYLIPGVPVSLAAINLIYSLVFVLLLATSLWRSGRRRA